MAILIDTKRPQNQTTVHPKDAARGFTLEEMYALIGDGCSCVQAIDLGDGMTMWMDEEAKLRAFRPDANLQATQLLAHAGGIPGDVVLGKVLVCRKKG